MTSATKTHLTAELVELRALVREFRHFLIPEVLGVLEDSFRCRPIPGCDLAERLALWRDAIVIPAEDRAGLPQHALAKVSRREMTTAGIGHPEYFHERQDGQPLQMCESKECERCGRFVFLLSVKKRTGGHFTAKVNPDGFRHDCDRGSF